MSNMITTGKYAGLLAKESNQGLVTTTGAAATDQIHAIPLGRSFYITKLMWYQATGANITMVLGTLDAAAVPALVAEFPTILAITGMPGVMLEEEIPMVEFILNSALLAAGRDGSLYVTSSAAGVLIRAEIAETI